MAENVASQLAVRYVRHPNQPSGRASTSLKRLFNYLRASFSKISLMKSIVNMYSQGK
jgi:hypothetical protein